MNALSKPNSTGSCNRPIDTDTPTRLDPMNPAIAGIAASTAT